MKLQDGIYRLSMLAVIALAGCSEAVGDDDTGSGAGGPAGGGGLTGSGGTGGTGGGPDITDEGTPLDVDVPDSGRVFVELRTPSVLGTDPAIGATSDWDLAFEGYNVFTNGGISGPGVGSAFGPYDGFIFIADDKLMPPFLIEDRAGGGFLDWYDYDGTSHALYSRYHVHAVRRGDEHYKVQLLSYYGEIAGAPVSAVYSVRYAEVTSDGSGPTQVVENLDGTAGGLSAPPGEPIECLRLATGARMMLTPDEAAESMDWDLCFQRDALLVNGGVSGPGGVASVDLERDAIASEQLDDIKDLTAAAELADFDAVTYGDLTQTGLGYVEDGVVTAFSGRWAESQAPVVATWWLVGGDGTDGYSIAFQEFANASETTPGTVTLRFKLLD